MATDENGQSWQDRLVLACHNTDLGNSRDQEDEMFRQEARKAPLSELRIFLESPVGRHEGYARAVMSEVLRQREGDKAQEESRKDWWRGMWQQASAQLLGGVLVGIVLGAGGALLSGALLCN
ncbi:hypothetical protein [Halomonas korlensis]|uniref:Uncharacterized protein n=1 Tax=Halomonas korlensis TaxID=463301 RepID=A0A1I7KLU3_9GAMM|nr:hypothetical protein [Halomonas korlensis]SFU98427.1 hypothetical protein SAMN04487955_1265 [Halomonas korlensis]